MLLSSKPRRSSENILSEQFAVGDTVSCIRINKERVNQRLEYPSATRNGANNFVNDLKQERFPFGLRRGRAATVVGTSVAVITVP